MKDFDSALKYLSRKRPEKAAPLFKKLLKDFPHKESHLNLGNCYRLLGKDKEASEQYLQAANPLTPFSDNKFVKEYPIALNNLGLLAYSYENDDVAEEFYRRAIKNDPKYYDAQWNLGNLLLRKYCSKKLENPNNAWKLYENRFRQSQGAATIRNTKKDLISWNGLDRVESLVILAEQGFGDMVMFGRYLKFLYSFTDKIWIQCDSKLDYIFSSFNICRDPIETDATHGIPMCNLAKVFSPRIPAGDWLKDKYVKKLDNGILDIGCVWSGSTTHTNDKYRSTTPNRFCALSSLGTLYTINPTEHGTKGFIPLYGTTWEDTIGNLSKLDLVITVDTSIAHVCGALGMECWVIMPYKECDFRWGDRSMGFDNIWYKSVKVIRNACNWDDSFKLVEIMLRERHADCK